MLGSNFPKTTVKYMDMRFVLLAAMVSFTAACGGGGGGSGGRSASADTDGDGIANSTDVDIDNDGLIEISTLEQLDWVRNDLLGTSRNDGQGSISSAGCPGSGCNGYELVADLDFDTNGDGQMTAADRYFDYDNDGNDNGWLPIGSFSAPFSANFNGNDHAIANLYIDRSSSDAETAGNYVGLFGDIETPQSGGPAIVVQKIHINGPLASIAGTSRVGALAGAVRAYPQVTVSDNVVEAAVIGYSSAAIFSEVGGMLGRTWGGNQTSLMLVGNSVSGSVTAEGTAVGGMLGHMSGAGTISGSRSDAAVTVTGDHVGGLIGLMRPNEPEPMVVDDCSAGGNVSGTSHVGGLVGYVDLERLSADFSTLIISHSRASGDVIGSGASVGGLVGLMFDDADPVHVRVLDSYAIGPVAGVSRVGGLVGSVEGNRLTELLNTFATGAVDGGTSDYVGGLAGLTYYTTIRSSFSNGAVNGNQYVGGLVGDANTGTSIIASFTTSSIGASTTTGIGAFVGWSDTVTYTSNYYEMDGSGLPGVGHVVGAAPGSNLSGFGLAVLECPTAPDDTVCAPSTLYLGWGAYLNAEGQPVWDFGRASELPGLLLNGVVYRNLEVL